MNLVVAGTFSNASKRVSNLGNTTKIIPKNITEVIPIMITGYMIAPFNFFAISHSLRIESATKRRLFSREPPISPASTTDEIVSGNTLGNSLILSARVEPLSISSDTYLYILFKLGSLDCSEIVFTDSDRGILALSKAAKALIEINRLDVETESLFSFLYSSSRLIFFLLVFSFITL